MNDHKELGNSVPTPEMKLVSLFPEGGSHLKELIREDGRYVWEDRNYLEEKVQSLGQGVS